MSIRMNSINLKLLTCTLIFVQNPYFSLFHTCCPVKFTMIRVSNTIATTYGTIVLLAGDTTNTFVLFRIYFDTLLARGAVECATVFFYNDKRRKYPMNTKLNKRMNLVKKKKQIHCRAIVFGIRWIESRLSGGFYRNTNTTER